MSNFFNHLLQRHQGETPRVEPRPRSRFEPDSLTPAALQTLSLWDEHPQNETPLVRHGTEITPPVSPAPRDVAPPALAPVSSITHELSAVPKAAPSVEESDANAHHTKPSGVKAYPGAPVQPRVQTQSRDDVTVEPPVLSHITAPGNNLLVSRPSSRQSVILDDPPRPIPPVAMDAGMQRHDEGQRTRMQQREEDSSRISPRVKLTTPPAPAGMPPVTTPVNRPEPNHPEASAPPAASGEDPRNCEGQLVPPAWLDQMQSELRHRWDFQEHSKQTEHVVNVTIGRVEVRAQAPTAPSKPRSKAKAPAVMGLDEYLNRRKGRGSL